MLVYFSGTILSVFFAYVNLKLNSKKQNNNLEKCVMPGIFAFLSFVPLTFIMAVRYCVGSDYLSYWYFFHYTPKYVESGYRLFNDILRTFFDSPQCVFVISSLIICGSYFYMIYRESISPIYSILMFVLSKDYFIAMNGVRQYMATAIMVLALPYIKEKKTLRFLICLLIAFHFHKSIIIFIPLYLLYIIDISPLFGGTAIVLVYFLSHSVRNFIFPILRSLGFYSNYFANSYANIFENFNWAYTLIFLCFFILLSFEYKSVKQNKELKLLYSAILLSLLILSLSAVMPSNVHRLTWHMNILIIIYTPLAIKKLKLYISKVSISNIIGIIILVAYALVTIPQLLNGNQTVLPYRTIWDK